MMLFTNKFAYRALVLCAALTFMVFGAAFGSRLSSPEVIPSPSPTIEPEDTHVSTGGQRSVLPNTEVTLSIRFSGCGHTVHIEADDLTGLTESDVAQKYASFEVREFTAESVALYRTEQAYCPKHYLLCADDDGLIVLHTDDDTLESSVYMRLAADPALIDPSDASRLADGIPFDSLYDIDIYLESMDS